MNKIELDDTSPSSVAYLTEQKSQLILQHGGTATRIIHDRVEVMGLETFLTTEVPKLRRGARELHIIRDSSTSSLTLLLDGTVTKYVVNDISDVALDKLSEYLKVTEAKSFYPNLKYPLIGYVETDNLTQITVLLEDKVVQYKNLFSKHKPLNETLYLPPLWFQVIINTANTIQTIKIAVAPESEVDCLTTELKEWPLTNIMGGGEVCRGAANMKPITPDITQTHGVIMQHAIDLVFTSEWQNHVTWIPKDVRTYTEAFEASKYKDEYTEAINKHSGEVTAGFLFRTISILREPQGWMRLPYTNLGTTAAQFLSRYV